MFDREYSEKRDYIRMFVNADVSFKRQGNNQNFQGKSRDISGKGVSFITSEPVTEGEILDIVVNAVEASVPPLEIVAKVMRTESQPNNALLVATVKVD